MNGGRKVKQTEVERLLPQERYEGAHERAPGKALAERIGHTNRIVGKQCAGLGGKKAIGEDTLWKLLSGGMEPSDAFRQEGLRRLEYAREGMGVREFRALHEEAGIPLTRLAQWKREKGQEDRDVVNGWLNSTLREKEEESRKGDTRKRMREVGEAAKRRRLTLVVGAGASRAKDANVPTYTELALEWGATEEEAQNPGTFFEKLKGKMGSQLHEELAKRLKGHTMPSEVHRWVVALTAEAGARTIATTNWDVLLEASQEEHTGEAEVWPEDRRAPGDGRIAKGIVHLHGSVERPAGMRVTDKELEEHYQAGEEVDQVGFLTELLGGRSVLYVGYSHNDLMVAEIQRRIGERERRRSANGARAEECVPRQTWSLIKQDGTGNTWRRKMQEMKAMGVEPIVYRDHCEVPELLQTLVEEVRRDAAWDRDRLTALGKEGASDSTDWEEVQELLAQGGPRLGHFLKGAEPSKWKDRRFLDAGARHAFGDGEVGEAGRQVADWLCHDMDDERAGSLLWMMAHAGGQMGPTLWHELGWAVRQDRGRMSGGTVEAVTTLLIESARKFESLVNAGHVICWIAERNRKDGRLRPCIEGWKLVTQPKLAPDTTLTAIENGEAIESGTLKPALALDTWETREVWKKAVAPVLGDIHREAWEAGLHAIERYQALADIAAGDERGFNAWAWGRKHIRPHGQNRGQNGSGEDAIIESMYRAIGEVESGKRNEREWWRRVRKLSRSKAALARRLAADAVEHTTHWGAERKLRWATTKTRFDDYEIRVEVWSLCRSVYAQAGEGAQKKFWKRVKNMRGETAEHRDKRRYDLMAYLRGGGIEDKRVVAEQQVLQTKHADWRVSPYPEQTSYWVSGEYRATPPTGWSAKEILRAYAENAEGAIQWLIEGWTRPVPDARSLADFDGPNEEGREKGVREAVTGNPEMGIALGVALKGSRAWDHPGWASVCVGAAKVLDEEQALRLATEVVCKEVVEGKSGRECGDFAATLAQRAWKERWKAMTRAKLQGTFVGWLEVLTAHDGEPRTGDLEMWTINTAAGKAVEAVVTLTGPERTARKQNLKVLDELTRAGKRNATLARHVRLASARDIHLLLHTSYAWAMKHVVEPAERAGEHSEERREWWTGLAYAHWDANVYAAMARALKREIGFREPRVRDRGESVDDTAARRYGAWIIEKVLQQGKDYEGIELEEIHEERRESVVRQVCGMYWRERELQREGAWEKVVRPLWAEVLERNGPTEEEQSAFLECFPFIGEREQGEFAERFVQGPAVAPGHMLDYEGHNGQGVNREAALEVVIHCASTYSRDTMWKWHKTLEKVAEWMKHIEDEAEEKLAGNLFALTGWR